MSDLKERSKEAKRNQLKEDYHLLCRRYEELSYALSWDNVLMDGFPDADRELYEEVLSSATDLLDALEDLADAVGVEL